MDVATYRVVAHAPATIRWQPVDQEGEPVTASGTPTAVVASSNGTAVVPTVGIVAGFVELDLTAAQTASLDRLSVSWLLDGVVRGASTVDIIGRPLCTVAEIREIEPTTADEAATLAASIRRARDEVHSTFERACGHVLSFVPRFSTAVVQQGRYGSSLALPHYFVRTVRWARYEATPGTWTAVDITGGVTVDDGYTYLNAGAWPGRASRLEVGYEHGLEQPDPELKRAAIAAIRRNLKRSSSGIDPRAMSHTFPNGEVQRFPTPGLGPWITGIPEIDELLVWYRQAYPVVLVA